MSELTESKHAALLRELGFVKRERQSSNTRHLYLVEDEQGIEPSTRTYSQIFASLPCFQIMTGVITLTCVIDEAYQLWFLMGTELDMSAYGFSPMFESHSLQ